jgi:HEAT repeat protein
MKGMKLTHHLNLRRVALASLSAVSCITIFCTAALAAQTAPEQPPEGDGFFAWLIEDYGFTVIFAVALVAFFVWRKVKSRMESRPAKDVVIGKLESQPPMKAQETQARAERRKALRPDVKERPTLKENERPEPAAPQFEASAPDNEHTAYGAYRIDQEVGKLVLGKPHRMDVMASRAHDDRRAIEASLIKALTAPDIDEAARGRARRALEDYGFVAQQTALLLQGRDAWERSSAARVLGQIGSELSLPSLLEALHDNDSVVRNQVVTSLGQLKHPAAIGALLDIARRHPDIPPSLLSQTLSACSVEGIGYLDSPAFDLNEPMGQDGSEPQELQPLFEDLPMGDEDDALLGLLTRFEGHDVTERTQIARELGSHKAQRAVSALCESALHDPDASVRSAAVTALGSIDHESVFAPVMIALADDTREVRAAAARTLSSLHFDRAAAYTRVMQSNDKNTLQEFAKACVKTGIVAQAGDRLGSEDRRQAHEAFCLFAVLAKAGEMQPIVDLIQSHKDNRVRLAAVHALQAADGSAAAAVARDLVSLEGLPEDVRTNILEMLYKLDNQPAVA